MPGSHGASSYGITALASRRNTRKTIFGVFERLHDEQYAGTGIGLAIVQEGVERVGGKVGVRSSPGQGSCFWFELLKASPYDDTRDPQRG